MFKFHSSQFVMNSRCAKIWIITDILKGIMVCTASHQSIGAVEYHGNLLQGVTFDPLVFRGWYKRAVMGPLLHLCYVGYRLTIRNGILGHYLLVWSRPAKKTGVKIGRGTCDLGWSLPESSYISYRAHPWSNALEFRLEEIMYINLRKLFKFSAR